jgi:hypothetical protein
MVFRIGHSVAAYLAPRLFYPIRIKIGVIVARCVVEWAHERNISIARLGSPRRQRWLSALPGGRLRLDYAAALIQ